jgi:hypothetical protein
MEGVESLIKASSSLWPTTMTSEAEETELCISALSSFFQSFSQE